MVSGFCQKFEGGFSSMSLKFVLGLVFLFLISVAVVFFLLNWVEGVISCFSCF